MFPYWNVHTTALVAFHNERILALMAWKQRLTPCAAGDRIRRALPFITVGRTKNTTALTASEQRLLPCATYTQPHHLTRRSACRSGWTSARKWTIQTLCIHVMRKQHVTRCCHVVLLRAKFVHCLTTREDRKKHALDHKRLKFKNAESNQ